MTRLFFIVVLFLPVFSWAQLSSQSESNPSYSPLPPLPDHVVFQVKRVEMGKPDILLTEGQIPLRPTAYSLFSSDPVVYQEACPPGQTSPQPPCPRIARQPGLTMEFVGEGSNPFARARVFMTIVDGYHASPITGEQLPEVFVDEVTTFPLKPGHQELWLDPYVVDIQVFPST